MKPRKELISNAAAPVADQAESEEIIWPEPQTELGAKIIALAKEIHESDLPKLSLEEIEEYLGRKLGGIAAAYDKLPRK
ncbi:MAG TPA: hypothetical protein PLD20_10030 [Blastocatellia bacterium]|nr:hypothetical protein [Blastocatellia bacterium]HMV81887.1 hypothetical protein [Blastocatellia bacterium]HMX25420.1 hypothetical protein [Blastocatellia bacterium]HMY76269.1 hypothetical protein [Blastocatellia bacterium]HMZ18257.1 hypothetical protein [Blastocatellia bacterium]